MNEIEMEVSNKLDINLNLITDSFVKKYGRYSNQSSHDEELDKLSSEMEIRLSPQRRLLSSSIIY
jgi:hypothetical protein